VSGCVESSAFVRPTIWRPKIVIHCAFSVELALLEPNPAYWSSLSYRACHVVAAVVGNATMEQVTFRFPNEKAAKGGIVGRDFDNQEVDKTTATTTGRRRQKEWRVLSMVRLSNIFERFQVPPIIDYLSLDVEGAEEFVMGTFPFDKYRFNILTLERPSDALSTLLQGKGYIYLKTLKFGAGDKPRETLWVHQSMKELLDLSALELDTQNYKYRENTPHTRIAPEEHL
jgi:Methyltransferase FkbM domain